MSRRSRSGLGMLCAGIALCGWGAARADQWDGVAWGQRAPGGMRAWFVLPTSSCWTTRPLPQTPAPRPVRPEGGARRVRVRAGGGAPGRGPEGRPGFLHALRRRARAHPRHGVAGEQGGHGAGQTRPRAALTLRSWPAGANGTGDVDRIPDPLLPDPVFDLQGGAYNRIWLTVRVPKDAAPGRYEGRVRLLGKARRCWRRRCR